MPTPLSKSGWRHDVITIFRYCADERKPDSRAIMSQPATPMGFGPSSFDAPAGPAEVIADCAAGTETPDTP